MASGGREPPETSPGTIIHTVRSEEPGLRSWPGRIMGTPEYVAPEQAWGEIERLDERADVFGLGAILCEVLTGRPPYLGGNVLQRAQLGALVDARDRLEASGADADLVRLALARLATEPDERPAHAGVVAGQVAAFPAGVRERLRQAELERAAADARVAAEKREKEEARAERRPRRLMAGLLAAGPLPVSMASGCRHPDTDCG